MDKGGQSVERRLFERKTLNLNAVLKVAGGARAACVIQDFCSGGLLIVVTESPELAAETLQHVKVGDVVSVEVLTKQDRFEIEAVVARIEERDLGLKLLRNNARMIACFQNLQVDYNSSKTQTFETDQGKVSSEAEREASGDLSDESDGESDDIDGMPQAEPRERDRTLAAMQGFTQQFLVERLAAFFKQLRDSYRDPSLWVAVNRVAHVRDVMDELVNAEATITDRILKQVLPFFTVPGLRAALETIDAKAEVEFSTQLSLVDKDDFEEWLHVKILARRLEGESQHALTALAARIRYLIGVVVTPENNGITPEKWVMYLRNCLQDIEIDFEALQIILDAYHKTLLSQLKIYYATLNTCLDDNGILPGEALESFIQETARLDWQKQLRQSGHRTQAEHTQAEHTQAEHTQAEHTQAEHTQAEQKQDASSTFNRDRDREGARDLESILEAAVTKDDSPQGESKAKGALTAAEQGDKKGSFSFGQAQWLAKRAYAAAQNLFKMNLAVTNVMGSTPLLADGSLAAAGGLSLVDAVLAEDGAQSELDDAQSLTELEVIQALDDFQKDVVTLDAMDLDVFDEDLLAFMKNRYGAEKHWNRSQANVLALTKKLFTLLEKNVHIGDRARYYLSKLSIPTFKALVLDSDVLLMEDAPVRTALDLLAKTGLKGAVINRVQDERIHKSINGILTEFRRDVTVFQPLIEHLKEVQKQQVWFFERNIERLRETCEGQYRITVNQHKVDEAINVRLAGRTVPKVVRKLVDCGWRDLIYFSLMKEGENSKAWDVSLVLLEDLIRFLSSKNIRLDALRMMPDKMMRLIERGLLKVTTPQNAHQQNELIPQLKLLLSRRVHPTPEDFESWEGTRVRPQVSMNTSNALRINVSAVTEIDEWSKPHLEKWLHRADGLALGCWLDFRLTAGGRMSGRLLWRAEDDSRLVFVNRQGMKLADVSLSELAEGLHSGNILILSTDAEPAIEHGLNSMIQDVYSALAHEVARDELTQMLSRREIELLVKRHLEEVHAGELEFFVVCVRVDHLASINDSYGYEVGDVVLKQLAERLFDVGKMDESVGRSSGTDFVMLLSNVSLTAARNEAERVLSSVMSFRFEWENTQLMVGASVGVVEVDKQYQSVDSILMDAQSACLTAQESGGNRIHVHQRGEKSAQRQQGGIAWASKVETVLAHNQLRLQVQKIEPTHVAHQSNADLQLPHYEVLIGSVGENSSSVVDFIAAAERYRRMSHVDRWVVAAVFDWMCTHRDFMNQIGGLSISISGNSMNDSDFMDHLFEMFTSRQVPCNKVCFEITETVTLSSLNDTIDFMTEMKNLGCLFAMDDFGSGVSSFSYLKHLPVDYLKIDGSFVKDMKDSRRDMAMVKSITDMGHLLGKKVMAENVTDAKTLELLKSVGVDFCQGAYVEEPIWLDEWLDNSSGNSSDHSAIDVNSKSTIPLGQKGVA